MPESVRLDCAGTAEFHGSCKRGPVNDEGVVFSLLAAHVETCFAAQFFKVRNAVAVDFSSDPVRLEAGNFCGGDDGSIAVFQKPFELADIATAAEALLCQSPPNPCTPPVAGE